MASGGARNRSGPPASATSGRSDRRGLRFDALPAGGYDGEAPRFPLPGATDRELEVWAEAWKTPQACAWATPSESWRHRTIALWVRTTVRCEQVDAGAALLSQLHRFADQIGLTPAGLAENGWAVSKDELAAKAAEKSEETTPTQPTRRLRAVPGA